MGTSAFSPQRAELFRPFLLLPSPSVVHYGRKPANLRVSLGAGASQLQASRLWVSSHAGACPPPAQRTATGYAGRCAEVVEARSVAATDGCGAFLAKAILRFQRRNYPQFEEKLRYIHRNPVKRGLCDRPDWQWSSFRHYATGAEGRVEIESRWTAQKPNERRGDGGTAPLRSKPGLRGPPSGLNGCAGVLPR